MSLAAKIESLLLVSAKPLSLNELAKFLKAETTEVQAALQVVTQKYDDPECGIRLLRNDNKVQFASAAEHAKLVREFMHDETTGELTKPSLETLTIIAYRQPISKEELEQIRGINCSLILRNLLIRGLIEAHEAKGGLTATYSVTMEFLRFLGVTSVEQLPDFQKLNSDENLQAVLSAPSAENSDDAAG